MNLHEQLRRVTGQDDLEVWYEAELARKLGADVKQLRQFLDEKADVVNLPALIRGEVSGGGKVFLLVSEFRDGFWVRSVRMR